MFGTQILLEVQSVLGLPQRSNPCRNTTRPFVHPPTAAKMDDAQHRRDEAARRAKRKEAKKKKHKSSGKGREYREKILAQQQGKKSKKPSITNFQSSHIQPRLQGFHLQFSFRNAPPRPPVGPTWMGTTVDQILKRSTAQPATVPYTYPLRASVHDLVPIVPSAMNIDSYYTKTNATPKSRSTLTADDMALLKSPQKQAQKSTSRVLHEARPVFMKKTTYLSNDYSRKVHDFKSLAQTQEENKKVLQAEQEKYATVRTAEAIIKTFQVPISRAGGQRTPKRVLEVLPSRSTVSTTWTHVVIAKPRPNLKYAWIGRVMQATATSRSLTCQVLTPQQQQNESSNDDTKDVLVPAHMWDMQVQPGIKEYALQIHDDRVEWIPLASKLQLSTGRPVGKDAANVTLERCAVVVEEENDNDEDKMDVEEDKEKETAPAATNPNEKANNNNDDGEGDFGDDDSSDDD